jgi:hypothetical protein
MSSARPETPRSAVVGCIGSGTIRDCDLVLASLLLEWKLCGSGEVRRAEIFARTLLTGLREDEDDEDEAVKLDGEDARRLSELLDIELSYTWRKPMVGRIERDLVVFCVRIIVCVGPCSC